MMKRLTLLLWVAGLFILGLSSLHAQTGGPFLPSAADNRCRQWVDSVLSGLNVHEKVGQLIVATIPARADKATKKQMRELPLTSIPLRNLPTFDSDIFSIE